MSENEQQKVEVKVGGFIVRLRAEGNVLHIDYLTEFGWEEVKNECIRGSD